MQTAIQQTFSNTHINTATQTSIFSKFVAWCAAQDQNRYGWLGISLGSQGCVFTPLTMFAIVLAGNSIVFWIVGIIAMMMVLVSNLAALPTKYTIPIFLLSVVIDITLIIACASAGFSFNGLAQ